MALSFEAGARDLRLALRALDHSPLFTSVALATLAAAIGLSTAVGSLVSSILLRPLPYPGSERLVRLSEARPDRPLRAPRPLLTSVTIGMWEQEKAALDALVPVSSSGQTVSIGGIREQLEVARVGDQFFHVLGSHPVVGRLLDIDDSRHDAPHVAVISRTLWTQNFGGRPDIAGTTILIDDVPHTVVGVAPAHVNLPDPGVQVWTPGRWRWALPGARAMMMMSVGVIGRMAPGADIEDVRREGQRLLQAIVVADPAFADGTIVVPIIHATRLIDDVVAGTRPALTALLAGMLLVLGAACLSLANLVVARNSARSRELAIRVALGASRTRLLRPLLFEQVILSAAGATLGAALGWWILRALPVVAPAMLPRLSEVQFDVRAFAAAWLLALGMTLLVGLRPAWRRPSAGLRDTSASAHVTVRARIVSAERFRGALVTAQVALAIVLLIGASLVGRSLIRLLQAEPGYQPEGVLTFQVGLPPLIAREQGRQTRFFDELIPRLRTLPGVSAVGVASTLPLHGLGNRGTFRLDGQPLPPDPADHPRARWQVITDGYLEAIGARLVAGRPLRADDHAGAMPVVLADERLADRYFGGEALGRRIRSIGGKDWTIVGIVRNIQHGAITEADEPALYYPSRQVGEILAYSRLSGGVAVRSTGEPTSLAPAIREIVRELSPEYPVFNVMPLADRLAATFGQPRFYSLALALFAALALSTAVLGVFGLQAYTVERRRSEFAVRRALGASEQSILTLVLRRALRLGVLGLALGLALGAAGSGLLRSMLFGVEPLDSITFTTVPLAVLAIVLAASWAPARRAARVDPALALHAE